MHIPDGYLSLQTSLPLAGVMIPIWMAGINKIKRVFNIRQIPLLALCTAFSFIIMMFNIPLGISSVHAVGAVFIAILLGPWAACIAVSIALVIQALVFGDGGVLAIGANCFNMAFIMPFTGYYIYRLASGNSNLPSRRSLAGVFLGSYFGLNAAALLTAVEFGIQPMLFKTAEGLPKYGFYPLSVSVPAIMAEHLLVAGIIEGVVTVSAVVYLARFSPHMFQKERQDTSKKGYKPFIIAVIILIAATPLGLLASGTAWGEWGVGEIKDMLGYVPEGLDKLSGFWGSLIPDYSVPGLTKGFFQSSVGYIVSAAIGVAIILLLMFISSRYIKKKSE